VLLTIVAGKLGVAIEVYKNYDGNNF
jgi:hypothetical protein